MVRTQQRLELFNPANVKLVQVRSRTKRACDKCNACRTRCDGTCPCRRCAELGYNCAYSRCAKRRGRKRVSDISEMPPIDGQIDRRGDINASSNDAPDSQGTADAESPRVASNDGVPALQHSMILRTISYQEHSRDDWRRSEGSATREQHPDSRQLTHDNTAQLPEPATTDTEFDIFPNQHLQNTLPAILTPSTNPYSNAGQQHLSARRYICLEPLLCMMDGCVTQDMAYQLLEYYFRDPDGSSLSGSSPYVLTPVLRKKSILTDSTPRPTSPALLTTMLWVSAQTIEISEFFQPGRRQKVCDHLQRLAFYFMYSTGQHSHGAFDGHVSSTNHAASFGKWEELVFGRTKLDIVHGFQHSLDQSRSGSVDDVLTYVLFAIVASAGEFKADCQIWWTRALRTAHLLRLNKEDDNKVSRRNPDETNGQPFVYETYFEVEIREERRRAFWLLYCLDRHLSLSYNRPLSISDNECELRLPLPDHVWENLEDFDLAQLQTDPPNQLPSSVTGSGFFEYFLPLMRILGSIVNVHQLRQQPYFGSLDIKALITIIDNQLSICANSVDNLAQNRSGVERVNAFPIHQSAQVAHYRDHVHMQAPEIEMSARSRTRLVVSYSTFILHVLYALLYGKWDAISMLENDDNWIGSPDYLHCTSHAIKASEAISQILQLDPDLSFMPYLLGIYLLHESFIILLFADRMSQVGPNESVQKSCETIIKAHEACIATLSTEFQRHFRKVLRSTLRNVLGLHEDTEDETRLKRMSLLTYRWARGGRGLCL